MPIKITSVEFAGAAAQPGAYPKLPYPEIAFAGRSNVGKSSLINRLLDRQIARISATPGRTRQLNFFVVNNNLTFVDLPGYGYAQVSKQERGQWQQLVEDYLTRSRNLSGVVIIVDIRRGPEEEEEALCDFLAYHQRPFLMVATKCDKLKRAQLEQQRQALAARLDGHPLLLFSAQDGSGKDELWHALLAFVSHHPSSSHSSIGHA
ncbi:MAG: YihA family ribosome biogenesis GTP-binding protein [Deltaproteobacteria bacterium]|nr:YihA family ribosome biogenesis GTP-binding protein [Deltaproteobacteria bacterium]